MAFGLFRKPDPKPAEADAPATVPAAAEVPHHDSAKEILELLELELGAMIRQLERAANSVAGGAQSTAATLSNIRARTDALTGRTSAAHQTATTFSQAAEKFTHSAEGIGSQVRDASNSPTRPARRRTKPASMWIACASPPPRSAMSST